MSPYFVFLTAAGCLLDPSMASINMEALFANHAFSILEVDRAASPSLRWMYHNEQSIVEALSHFNINFAVGLSDIVQSPTPPTASELMSCTLTGLDLKNVWLVYMQWFGKDEEIFSYCGSTVAVLGSGLRLAQYDNFLHNGGSQGSIPEQIIELHHAGYEHLGTSILAAGVIPNGGPDFYYLRALIKLLEGTFTSKFWAFLSTTMGSLSGSCLWDIEDLPWQGLCTHSPLYEVCPPIVQDPEGASLELRQESLEDFRRRQLQNTYNWLEKLPLLVCEGCPYDYSTKFLNVFREHQITCPAHKDRINAPDLVCMDCPKGYTTKSQRNLIEHQKICPVHTANAPIIVCEGCPVGYTCKSPRYLYLHQKNCPAHKMRILAPDIFCEGCPTGFKSNVRQSVIAHQTTCPAHHHKAPDLTCDGCPTGYTTKSQSRLSAHKKKCPAHQDKSPDFICENCPKAYSTKVKTLLTQHQQHCPAHRDKFQDLVCDGCPTGYCSKTSTGLNQHQRFCPAHRDKFQDLMCIGCPTGYRTKSPNGLNNHQQHCPAHRDKFQDLVCIGCPTGYRTKDLGNLKSHQRTCPAPLNS